MNRRQYTALFVIIMIAICLNSYAATDYLLKYSPQLSSEAVEAAKVSKPPNEFSNNSLEIFKVGFAFGYDAGKKSEAQPVTRASLIDLPDEDDPQPALTYIVNTESNKFHIQGCRMINQMLAEHKQEYVGTFDEMKKMGYSPCGICLR